MNTQQLVEIITDAVTDAVREHLPRLVAEQLDARMAQAIMPALESLRRAMDAVEGTNHERITALETDFATRAIAQADTLTASWQAQVKALGDSIVEQVAQAAKALPSLAGPAGPPGPPGPAGRDGATLLSPVHWKEGTTYTRGTLVHHRSGLWQANQDSAAEPGSGADGYTLVMDGHEPATFRVDADGFLVSCTRYASGFVRETPTGLRPMIYRGVYDHATSYLINDVVTANGSAWTCKAPEACGLRPGTDEGARAWQLTVKCGRDGRDGIQGARGERGERGEVGPPGATRAPKVKANGTQA